MSWLKIVLVVIAVIVAAGFVRYGSAAPCDWLIHDMAAKAGIPKLAVRGLLVVQFGGSEPTAGQCVSRWVDLHVNGLEPQLTSR